MPLLKPSPEFLDLIRKSGSANRAESETFSDEIAKAIQLPLREGLLAGDIASDIFERIVMAPGSSTEFPIDLLSPGEESDFVAYVAPSHGRVPERTVEGDYVMVPTYTVRNSIDWLLRYAREARWDIISRATQVFEAGFVKKINDDCWHTILAAGVDRGIQVYDADAAAGQFTKRLVSLMKVVMRRNAGGNSTSIKRGMLTDVYLSPEGVEDMRNWGVDQLDETSRREIYVAGDGAGSVSRVFGVNINAIDELGEGQEYQNYYSVNLSGTLGPSSDVELVVGLDLSSNDSFIMPVKEELVIHNDPFLHRQGRGGIYGQIEIGVGVLDTRRVLIGSF